MQGDTPLFQKIYDFYKFYFEIVDHFPKKSREVLAVKIENKIIESLEIVSQVNFAPKEEKISGLKDISTKIDFLKILFRFCFDLKIIDQKKYFIAEQKLIEIGKMTGGWLKSANRNP